MTLSEVREGLPLQLISRHVKSHQDDKRGFADLTRPAQLNVLADHRAAAALNELRAARKTTEFYPLPACRGYLCDASGYITSREIRTLRTELPKYELRAYLQKRNNELMLAHDRRVLDVPLEERLQSRTSELLAWAKTMLPVSNRSVRDVRAQSLLFPPSNSGHHGPQSSHADSTRRPRAIANW
jgi:hypothetical protein